VEIRQPGKYKVKKTFTIRNATTISKIKKGDEITITQVDKRGHKILGTETMDWMPWDLPVEPVEG